jgi:hypothetical protein
MHKMCSNIRNQHGSFKPGCLISLASVGIFCAILIPQWRAHVDRIREHGGSTEAVWIANLLWLGSPIALSILVGLVTALFRKRNYQEKNSESYFELIIVSLGATSLALSAIFIIVGVVMLILKLF